MYSRYKSLVRYIIWKCFLGICVLSFHFLEMKKACFETRFKKKFNSHFLFLLMLFVSYLEFLCKILFYEDFILFFSSKRFILLLLQSCLDPLWVNFYKCSEIRVHFYSFACDYAVSVYHLLNNQFFSLNGLCIFRWISVNHECRVHSRLTSLFHWSVFLSCASTTLALLCNKFWNWRVYKFFCFILLSK